MPVHLAVDTGVFTGAVFFQVRPEAGRTTGTVDEVHVFADYLAEGRSAEANARAIRELARHALRRPARPGHDRPGRQLEERRRADGPGRIRAGPA